MISLSTAFAIGFGGFIGAILRSVLTGFFNHNIPYHAIAVGTLGVNILGSLIMGILFAFFHHTEFLSPSLRSFLSTGMLGALTTYSTFAWESFYMLQHGRYAHFALNISANIVGTITAVAIGYLLVSYFLK
jgi:fluoride exporter